MKVYLDNAATTKVDDKVVAKMQSYYLEKYGNPSSLHAKGEEAFQELHQAKSQVAKLLNTDTINLIFTGSASEANNFIIKGVARANKDKGKHIIISNIEHPCVLGPAKELTMEGFEVEYIPVNKKGLIQPSELKKRLRKDTLLVSIMTANNEIGTIQDIKKLAKLTKANGSIFHTDAVQSVPDVKLDIKNDNIDFLTLSAHKFHGPKGVGLACINPNIKIRPLISGSEQNKGLRAGTIDVPGIVGFAEALKIAYQGRQTKINQIKKLRNYFYNQLEKELGDISLNGDKDKRLANNLNVCFKGVEGEAILVDLSQKGICVSTGSACSAHNLKVSYVLQALRIKSKYLNSNIRFSLSKYTTKKELDYTIKEIKKTIKRLKNFSPIK